MTQRAWGTSASQAQRYDIGSWGFCVGGELGANLESGGRGRGMYVVDVG